METQRTKGVAAEVPRFLYHQGMLSLNDVQVTYHFKQCRSRPTCGILCLCVSGKTRVANGVEGMNRPQRASSPGCLASSEVISKHAAGVASARLVPATGASSHQSTVAPVRKSACLGGQSLASSAAKRLLARPACRGGRMMPEQPAKNRAVKKKPKPKRSAPKPAVDENKPSSLCPSDAKLQPSQPAPVSASQNTITPVAAVSEKPKTDDQVPAATAKPRIVIKIHQGRIVSPPVIASSSASSVSGKKHAAEHHGSDTKDDQDGKPPAARPHRTEKPDRIKIPPVSKLSKELAGSKSRPKIASQSTSSKVLADRNSSISYFDSDQLQNSGSFDKLSLDYCTKLYSQLKDQQKASHPSPSSQNSKSSKHASTSKSLHKSSSDRTARASEAKKRSFDQVRQASTISESSPKMNAIGSNRFSASKTPDCTVQLNRIKSVNDTRTLNRQLSGDGVGEKLSCGRERQHSGLGADDDVADDCCSVTLTPRSQNTRGDSASQRSSIPTATQNVPGSAVPLSRLPRSFSKRSHTPTEADCTSSSKKSRTTEMTNHSNSSQKSNADLPSSQLSHSENKCTSTAVKSSDKLLSGSDVTHLQAPGFDITDNGKLRRGVEEPGGTAVCAEVNILNVRNVNKAGFESVDGSVSETEHSMSLDQNNSRVIDDHNFISASTVSKPNAVKKSKMLHLDEASSQSTMGHLVSDSTSDANSASGLAASGADSAISQDITVNELSSVCELPSSDVRWMSPSSSPNTHQNIESSAVPLRLKIRRLADVSPVTEIYNVVGQDAESDSTASTACGMSY